MTAYRITPLGQHDIQSFSSGEPLLDKYLRQYAGQDIRRNVSRIFVAEAVDDPSRVVGYYALSAGSVGAAEWPGDLRRKLPHYPVPVAILGRLAVDSAFQGRKLGAILLADACGRVVLASSTLAVHALVVDALNDRATSFYQHFGFMPFPGRASKLFLPLKTIQQQMAPEVRA